MSALPTPKPGTSILPQHDNMDEIATSAVESVTPAKYQLRVDLDEREGSKRPQQDSQVSSSTSSTAVFRLDPTRACFLDLPGELRNKIYDLVVTNKNGYYMHTGIGFDPKTKKFIHENSWWETWMFRKENIWPKRTFSPEFLKPSKVLATCKLHPSITQVISALGLTNRVVRREARTYFYGTAFWNLHCTPEAALFPYSRFLELIKADGRSTISNMYINDFENPAENPAHLASFLHLLSECQNLRCLAFCCREWLVHKQDLIDYIFYPARLPAINVSQLAEGFPRIEKLECVAFDLYCMFFGADEFLPKTAAECLQVLVDEVRKELTKALRKHCRNVKVYVTLEV
ncbi:hypothetical protein K505DRAFT_362206 [Melanomma pulvis-pyrius CBS 109.77]|uniref:Uncharacterized protein n=1 Tax=Melanomma pulvis-pyrius CBS 109.77 TaxID=1314802 RepID=A0A6A6X9H1_9PLEO|nr:hypothetical protein K505DRAFT_362206 [Melanomma pulvis-pyrius CBS 109.77]